MDQENREMHQGTPLDLGGATVIGAEQFAGDESLVNLVIPEGVAEIGERAFCACPNLESVVFPSSLRKIGKMAFMGCRNLKAAELQEGVEEIETNAFGATNSLGNVILPDSLQKVDRNLFGLGGGSPFATACMSGDLARRLMEEHNRDAAWIGDAVNACGYVIDGTAYETMAAWYQGETPEAAGKPLEFSPEMVPEGMDPEEFRAGLDILDEEQRNSLLEAIINLKTLQKELADLQSMAGGLEGETPEKSE